MTRETPTHSTIKNEQGEITHYLINVEGVQVGTATKTEKGQFDFKAIPGAAQDLEKMRTMRDLKVEVLRTLVGAYVDERKEPAKPKANGGGKAKKAAKGDPKEAELAAVAAHSEKGAPESDITLD